MQKFLRETRMKRQINKLKNLIKINGFIQRFEIFSNNQKCKKIGCNAQRTEKNVKINLNHVF